MKKKRERERKEWGQDLCPREGAVIVKEERSPHWTGAKLQSLRGQRSNQLLEGKTECDPHSLAVDAYVLAQAGAGC